MKNKFHVRLCLLLICFGFVNALKAQIIEVSSIKCFGDSTGQLAVLPDSGSSPYRYLWNNGDTTQNIDGLVAGNYSVTVTDSAGGIAVFKYLLNGPLPITATYTLTPNNSWPVNSGSILIHASGGSGWYKYTITDSTSHKVTIQSTPFFNSLASGTYYVTISDLYDCKRHDTVHIIEDAGLQVAISLDTMACYRSTAPSGVQPSLSAVYPVVVNFDNAIFDTIVDTTAKGHRPYVMSIVGDTLASISAQFKPGFHEVIVYSADNMGFRYSWTVDSVVAPISIAWNQTNNICFGNNTGTISSLAQGSYNDFTYRINGPKGFSTNTNSAGNLYAGEYNVIATDFAGCSLSQSVLITQPDEPLYVVFDETVNPRCPYSADGKITIHRVDGATDPITYLWSSGQNTPTIDSLYPGTYTVVVTDSNNCIARDSIALNANNRACIFNVVTPNGDGYNDYLDLSDICKGLEMQAEIFNDAGNEIATLTQSNPRWNPLDAANPPTGTASTYTVFIELTKNNQPYKKWAESFSVIYPK
jgi:hypothetical protein